MKNSGKPLNEGRLQELALRYVGRYATTRHKLRQYLARKLRERGWEGEKSADPEALIEQFSRHGYVDDELFATTKATALGRRGYGVRRVQQAMFQAGIEEEDSRKALQLSEEQKWQAADQFARRKSIGPYATEEVDRDKCQKQLAAFLRAGHSYDLAAKFVFAKPGEEIDLC